MREVDRRDILRRIENGEKQANLVKEYQAVLRCGVQQRQNLVLVALCSHEKTLGRILKNFAKLRIEDSQPGRPERRDAGPVRSLPFAH
ncbi:reverse transcriptase [Globisporangium polare]